MKKITPAKQLKGIIRVPGDKSLTHRALILGALAEGVVEITGFSQAKDCARTLYCLRQLGVQIKVDTHGKVVVLGKGLGGLVEPQQILFAGNSGTTLRLLAGVLSGQSFTSFLNGDASLRQRPMGRIVFPLRKMGACIQGRKGGTYPPLAITGKSLKPINHQLSVASAQAKSALLLAALYAPGWTEIKEPLPTRDHTEKMLKAWGAKIEWYAGKCGIEGLPHLKARPVFIPGDFSAAAFFIVAALIVPHSHLKIEGVGLNPTRRGLLEVLQAMGASIKVAELKETAGEMYGTIEVKSSSLRGISIGGEIIPRLIDEVPILAVAALFAEGITEIRGAAELKVKESNRLRALAKCLSRLGGQLEELPDGLRIHGGYPLQSALCSGYGDHRLVMSLAIAGLRIKGGIKVTHPELTEISFPGFWDLLAELRCE